MNQEGPIYRKTLGALCSRLRHRLHQRIVNLLMVHSEVWRWFDGWRMVDSHSFDLS